MTEQQLLDRLALLRADLVKAVDELRARKTRSIDLPEGTKPSAYRAAGREEPDSLRDRATLAAAAGERRVALRGEETEILTALETLRRADVAKGVRRAPLLSLLDLPNANACPQRWDQMEGDGDVRACARCKKNVRNVVGLDPHAAADVLASETNPSKLHRRADGTIVADDCRRSSVERTNRNVTLALFAVVAVMLTGLVLQLSHASADEVSQLAARRRPATVSAPKNTGYPLSVLAPREIELDDVRWQNDGYVDFHMKLKKTSDGVFLADGGCLNGPAFKSTIVTTSAVDAFIAELNLHRSDPGTKETPCVDPKDPSHSWIRIVDDRGATTTMTSFCNREWLVGDDPKDRVPIDVVPGEHNGASHTELAKLYADILHAAPVLSCPLALDPREHGMMGLIHR